MGVKLVSSGGGSVEINPPATASNFTATMPAGTGTVAVQGASTNIVSGTAVASTSGTAIDFTGIPSWVKRITVMFQGLSTNGSSAIQIQIGAGSITTSGYLGGADYFNSTPGPTLITSGFAIIDSTAPAIVLHGLATICLLGSNNWVYASQGMSSNSPGYAVGAGSLALGGTLDRVRITTVSGTDTFDAGTINIMYE
jgi:hypothetical protein